MDVCCVPSCRRTRQHDNVSLHTLPSRLEQLQKWCHNLRLDASTLHKGLRVCSAHFEPYCIGGCMRPFAVPTLELGHASHDIYHNPTVIKKLNIRETCCVPHCKRNRERDHANLHCFPSDAELRAKWCENLRRAVPDDSKLFNDAICERHFEPRCLHNKRLKKWALPTLNLGHDNLPHPLPTLETEVCCVASCQRSDVKLYPPPQDTAVANKWLHNLQLDSLEQLAKLRVCALHFEKRYSDQQLQAWA